MTIVINTRFLNDIPEGFGYFISGPLVRMAQEHSEHRFIFLFDRPFGKLPVLSPNVEPVVAGPPARHPLLWKIWYDLTVPRILKKYKADIFVSPDGFCSLRTNTPQCLVIHDLAFLHYPGFYKASHHWFYRHYTGRFIKKAKRIVTVSSFSKEDILSHYKVDPAKVDIVSNSIKETFSPGTPDQRQATKDKYTGGREYFIYTGAIHPRKNLMNLLRAFSIFKKRQQTNMKLVLAGRLAWKFESFVKSLRSYKYRDDVVITGYLPEEELAALTAGAYAMVYVSLFEGFGVPVLEAMKSGVPVITTAGSAMEEIAAGAALLADAKDHTAIAEQMMRIYKDEKLRGDLIGKGTMIASSYTPANSAARMWESIMKTIQ